jgi:site-specific DNA-methyltransferase (cytosine-N4-specific)
MIKSDLPFGSEFSPSQIDLVEVLEIAKTVNGNWKEFEEQIRKKYFDSNKTSLKNRKKLANNCKLGMIAYGIIDRNAQLTEFGEYLYKIRHDSNLLYKSFAQHILKNLHGVSLVQCILDMHLSGENVTLIKLREWLEERGIHFPSGGKHPSIMRLWLEKAGIFKHGWQVDETKFKEILGLSIEEIEILSTFSQEQKAYLKTLANMGDTGPFLSNEVKKLASATYGVKFDEKNLPKQVLYPLEKAGYIKLTRGTKVPGRGAKPFLVEITEKFKKDILLPLIEQLEKQVLSDIRPLLKRNLVDILRELHSEDTYKKGLALEALAFKLLRLLDMDYVATRLRGTATGGAEVDLIFHSTRLVYSRWQVQCKNTKRVALDDVAKEVGLTHFLKSNVIVIISTGKIGEEARRYANKIMTDSNLSIVMIDGEDIKDIIENPSYIVDVFNREAHKAMKLKSLDVR